MRGAIRIVPVLVSLVGAAQYPFGYPECSCIDPHPIIGASTDSVSCPNGVISVKGTCYDREYGSRGCRAYDLSSAACQVPNPPEYCTAQWCYVRPWSCTGKAAERSRFFARATVGNSTLLGEIESASGDPAQCTSWEERAALVYSYATCGNLDSFSVTRAERWNSVIARGPLRLTIPGDDPPNIVTVGANVSNFVQGTSRRDGSFVRFVTEMLDSYEVPWVEVPISQDSQAYSPDSSFTACVHDVSLNNTDICAGSVWALEFRRRIVDFSATITQVNMHVVAFKSDDAGLPLDEALYRPFAPFSPGMWFGLLAALVYAGYALYALEAAGFEQDETDDVPVEVIGMDGEPEIERGLTAHAKRQLKSHRVPCHSVIPTTLDDAKHAGTAMAQSVQSFLGGGDFRQEPRSPQAWLVFFGLAFLILVTISNYTAQVTGMVVASQERGTITSLEEGINRNYIFCGWNFAEITLTAAEPRLAGRYRGYELASQIFEAMDSGTCQAAIVDGSTWESAETGAYSPEGNKRHHCETKIKLPQTVYSLQIALPVRAELQRLVSWSISKAIDAGDWASADQRARERFLDASACSDSDTDAADDGALDFDSGSGVIYLSIALTTLGLIMNACWRCSPCERAARRQWLLDEDAYRKAVAAHGPRRSRSSHTGHSLSQEDPKQTTAQNGENPKRAGAQNGEVLAVHAQMAYLEQSVREQLNAHNQALNAALGEQSLMLERMVTSVELSELRLHRNTMHRDAVHHKASHRGFIEEKHQRRDGHASRSARARLQQHVTPHPPESPREANGQRPSASGLRRVVSRRRVGATPSSNASGTSEDANAGGGEDANTNHAVPTGDNDVRMATLDWVRRAECETDL